MKFYGEDTSISLDEQEQNYTKQSIKNKLDKK